MNENRLKYIEMYNELDDGDFNLTSFEEEFLDNIEDTLVDDDGFLTEKQIEILDDVYEKYCNQELDTEIY